IMATRPSCPSCAIRPDGWFNSRNAGSAPTACPTLGSQPSIDSRIRDIGPRSDELAGIGCGLGHLWASLSRRDGFLDLLLPLGTRRFCSLCFGLMLAS